LEGSEKTGATRDRERSNWTIFGHLDRYTHHIALNNARILGLDGEQVHLRNRDNRDGVTRIWKPTFDATPEEWLNSRRPLAVEAKDKPPAKSTNPSVFPPQPSPLAGREPTSQPRA